MRPKLLIIFVVGLVSLWGQHTTDRRSASIRGDGGGDGKCTIEVTVDGIAEVEIRGESATIRTISGAPASFRRFECNQRMPSHPYDFQFRGVDGRGRQDLVRSPENSRSAVVRIEDSQGGSEGYTFDVKWRGGNNSYSGNSGYRSGYGGNTSSYSGWNDGWGNGSGWNHNDNVKYSGRGEGELRDRNGNRKQLHNVEVGITPNGQVVIGFDGDWGKIALIGKVQSRSGRTIYANVTGNNMKGVMEIEMSSHDHVRRIYMKNQGHERGELRWSN